MCMTIYLQMKRFMKDYINEDGYYMVRPHMDKDRQPPKINLMISLT